MKTRLFCNYWNTGSAARQTELDKVIAKNTDNPDIDEIILITDGSLEAPIIDGKISYCTVHEERPEIGAILRKMNTHLTGPKDISIFVNTDCFFGEGDLAKIKNIETRQHVFALTRQDCTDDLKPLPNASMYEGGQDAWVFTGRIRPLRWDSFPMGCPRCDWALAWQLKHTGYTLVNPSHDIKLYHLHSTQHRNYGWPTTPPQDRPCGFTSSIPITPLNGIRFPTNTLTGIMAYSLFGADPFYLHGACFNAESIHHMYPGFISRFYVGKSVPEETIKRLRDLLAEIIILDDAPGQLACLWRLKSLEDPSVDIVGIRDADSRMSIRERAMFDAWLESGTDYHAVRDHPAHLNDVLLSCFHSRKPFALPEIDANDLTYNADERYFSREVIPIIKDSLAIHDTFNSGKVFGTVRLESPPFFDHWKYHVGARVWQDSCMDPNQVDMIYFPEEYQTSNFKTASL